MHVVIRQVFLLLSIIFITYSQDICNDQFESSSVNFESPITDIVFTSSDYSEVYVLTNTNSVYKSTDSGKSFININNSFDDFGNTFGTSKYGVRSIIKGAEDNLVYFAGASNKIYWITRGEGIYKAYPTGNDTLYTIQPHPEDSDLVLRSLITCLDGNSNCTTKLEVSQTQGSEGSWVFIRDYVYSSAWGTEANQILYVSVPENLMHGDIAYIPIADTKIYMTYSLNSSYTYETESGFFAFAFDGDVLYAVKYDSETGLSDLYISPDGGESYVEAQFQGNNQITHVDSSLYIILDDSEGVSFLTVCNTDEDMAGNLYQADLGDGEYWLTVPNLRATCSANHFHGADFQKINGMNGIYISNSYNSTAFSSENNDIEDYIQTGFSINKGGSWSRIPVPSNSFCNDNCFLNLFGGADTVTSDIYSTDNAIGIVIATGTEGEFQNSYIYADTYLSRNGGYTWDKIKEGPFKYSQANHGSLLVMVSIDSTTELVYSWNQGIDWNSCEFETEQISVDEIVNVSPTTGDTVFLIVGSDGNGNGAISYVNFADILPQECQGLGTAGTDNSDYEYFRPEVNGICLSGQQMSYIRRKRDSVCVNFANEISSVEGSCECTRFDYTCDGNCWAESLDGQGNIICVNACVGLASDPEAPPEDCNGTYMKPSGYRLVDGDQCVDGIQLSDPIETACPSESTASPMASITPTRTPSLGSPPSDTPSPTLSPIFLVGSYTPVANASASPSTTPTVGTSESGISIGVIIGVIGLVIILLLLFGIALLLVLYKTNPKVRGLINTYLPKSMGGGPGETKLYSVLGDGGNENSLFADDDMFIDDNVNVPVSSDNTPLNSLLDFDDDDAEGAIDIQL